MTPPVAVPMVEPGAKVRMVQSIEHLDPELMLEAFLEPRVFDD